jgi:preprotein translocase subunit SecE
MQKIIQYLKDVRAEMLKVSWPTRNELTGATTLVIVFSIISAIFVYSCDLVINFIVGQLLKINM